MKRIGQFILATVEVSSDGLLAIGIWLMGAGAFVLSSIAGLFIFYGVMRLAGVDDPAPISEWLTAAGYMLFLAATLAAIGGALCLVAKVGHGSIHRAKRRNDETGH